MASGPTQLTVTYGTGNSTAVLPIPPALIGANSTDVTSAVKNSFLGGGFFLPNSFVWIPSSQITQIAAS
jgi:hypothetical protein